MTASTSSTVRCTCPAGTALQQEVSNLTDAIAGGLLKSSPALAKRLHAAESELASLQGVSAAKAPKVGSVVPRVAKRYRAMLARLDENLSNDPERARAALQDVIGSSVTLQPDKSDKFLWAEFGIETAATTASSRRRKVGNSGSGGVICAVPTVPKRVRVK